jgi:hypothetical protein
MPENVKVALDRIATKLEMVDDWLDRLPFGDSDIKTGFEQAREEVDLMRGR